MFNPEDIAGLASRNISENAHNSIESSLANGDYVFAHEGNLTNLFWEGSGWLSCDYNGASAGWMVSGNLAGGEQPTPKKIEQNIKTADAMGAVADPCLDLWLSFWAFAWSCWFGAIRTAAAIDITPTKVLVFSVVLAVICAASICSYLINESLSTSSEGVVDRLYNPDIGDVIITQRWLDHATRTYEDTGEEVHPGVRRWNIRRTILEGERVYVNQVFVQNQPHTIIAKQWQAGELELIKLAPHKNLWVVSGIGRPPNT